MTRSQTVLNGKWVPIAQEMGGKILPTTYFAHQKLVLQDSNYTVFAESIDKGIVHILEGKMDIYGKEGVNAGKHFTAIYKLEDSKLKICYNLLGGEYPLEFNTEGKPLYFLSTFVKEGSK